MKKSPPLTATYMDGLRVEAVLFCCLLGDISGKSFEGEMFIRFKPPTHPQIV